jgi:penicillin-binding protein 2
VQRVGAYAPELQYRPPVPGKNLVLSLDLLTQRAAEDGLAGHSGAVVAIDPSDGDVLALASEPGFDPAEFARGITQREYSALVKDPDKPLLNRALRGVYPSGSTIKPAIALAALTYRVMDPYKIFYSNGIFHLPGSSFIWREDRDGPRGALNMEEAIARSSDIYFYNLASILGVDRIDTFLAPFGYGRLTGIDIAGEKPGLLPSPAWKKTAFRHAPDQVWFPGDTVNLGVGQGYLLVTPLQLAHIAGVLAERGKSFRPRLLIGTRDSDGHVTRTAPVAEPAVQGVSEASWDLVLNAMHHTTTCEDLPVFGHTCGTAYASFKNAQYQAAGKTGTAQVYTVSRSQRLSQKGPEQLRDHAWFIAFAPVDKPRIAVAVLVEHGGFGAQAAAPIAREVMDAYLLRQFTPHAAPPAFPHAAPPTVPRAAEPRVPIPQSTTRHD